MSEGLKPYQKSCRKDCNPEMSEFLKPLFFSLVPPPPPLTVRVEQGGRSTGGYNIRLDIIRT